MDSQIYMLLASADKEKNVTYVRQAFGILDPNMSIGKEKSANDVENFSQNLYVECAEKAIYVRIFISFESVNYSFCLNELFPWTVSRVSNSQQMCSNLL